MKLSQYMNIADKTATFGIGSATGYMFFTTRRGFRRAVKEANRQNLKNFATRIQTNAYKAASASQHERSAGQSALKTLLSALSNYTPIEDREVKEAYILVRGENLRAVIIEGNEIGRYWYKEEWEERHDKPKTNGKALIDRKAE